MSLAGRGRLIFIALVIGALPILSAAADGKKELVSYRAKLEFIPERGLIVVQHADQSLLQYKALLVPPLKRSETDLNSGQWLIGTLVDSPQHNPAVSYSVFYKGKQDESFYYPAISLESLKSAALNSAAAIKEELNSKRQIAESLEVQYNTQAAGLKRLRADAEVIANLGRIVEVVEEIEITRSELENLEKDIDHLKSTFQAVRSLGSPKNYLRRELELTKHSGELLKMMKATQREEEGRKALSQEDVQAKLALIEETRFEDEDKLKEQLIQLKTGASPSPIIGEPVKNYWEVE